MSLLDVSQYLNSEAVTSAELCKEIEARNGWFHSFDFSNGIRIAGRDSSHTKLHALRLPETLDGLSVIDIGAYEGYFSFQAEALGAKRVVAADKLVWTWPGSPALDNFRFVRQIISSKVEERQIAVEDLNPDSVGLFDVSLFLGVLYHAPNMMHYLERVISITKRFAVIETLVDLLDIDVPAAAFYTPNTVNNDSSNYWGPNIACVEGMLKRVGFSRVEFIGIWELNTLDSLQKKSALAPLKSGRAIWHAYV